MKELVKSIYIDSNISNSDHSVYKVLDIKDAIPASKLITKDVRKAIVTNMMSVVGIDTVKVIDDADVRVNALKTELDKATASITETTQVTKQSIADLESQIKALRNDMAEKQLEYNRYRTEITEEIGKINSTVQILTTI
jgi:predicted  nucleic acid-binding Zn-ribbon protein